MLNESSELEKSTIHIIVEIIAYVQKAVVSKTILKKITGDVTITCFDVGQKLAERLSPFDTYIQIIDGAAQLTINQQMFHLKLGDGIIIPAHAQHRFDATEQFKMISTVIKSGYEE